MIPRFLNRRIGEVNIFEIHGIFSEPWVRQIKAAMVNQLEESPAKGLLFNVRDIEKVDHPGAETLLAMARKSSKAGIWGHNLSAYFIAEHMNPQEPIPIFDEGKEAVVFFGREFAKGGKSPSREKRRFPRVKMALPVEFELKDFGESFFYEAAVTNLSEGGLYGHFLDSTSEELARRTLDPFDLKLLKIRLRIGKEKAIEMEGKVLRMEKGLDEAEGLALEFYNLRPEDQVLIQEFLRRERAGKLEEGRK